MEPLFIGVDLGTSGCRACLIDGREILLAASSRPLPPSRQDESGASTQDPGNWRAALSATLRELGQHIGASREAIAAIAIDGTSGSLLAADHQGHPLSPALMYDDRTSIAAADQLARLAPANSQVLSPGSGLAKLLRLRERLQRPFLALHQADWLLGKLSGQFGHSDENNALKLGYDPILRQWPGWMDALELPPGTLPQVHPVATAIGSLRPEVADLIDFPRHCLVCCGTTDSTAAALATGIRQPGQAVTVLGSSLVMKILGERPLFAADHGIYSHRLGEHWLVGGASNSGGAVLLKYFSPGQLAEMTPHLQAQRPTGLDYYPLSRPGERFPRNDPGLAPRLHPRPAADRVFFQALLEGMAAIEAEAYGLLERLGAPRVTEVFSIGGGAANPAWLAIRQRRLGVPVSLANRQGAAFGSALLARRGWQVWQGTGPSDEENPWTACSKFCS